MSLKDSWNRLLKAVASVDEAALGNLRPGASLAQIRDLETEQGFQLTPEMADLLSMANGEKRDRSCQGVFFGFRLYSTDEILARHRDMCSQVEEGIIGVGEGDDLRKFGQTWWPGWVMFGEQDGFLNLVTDHIPAPAGNKGQVFFRTHSQQLLAVKATSLTEFVDKYTSLVSATDGYACPLDIP